MVVKCNFLVSLKEKQQSYLANTQLTRLKTETIANPCRCPQKCLLKKKELLSTNS